MRKRKPGPRPKIEADEPQVRAFVSLNIDRARAAADMSSDRWKQGQPLSAIDGMPVGIKDIIETVDMPTECGSPIYKGWQSNRDAAVVAALREAGAIIIGKTVTTEFAAMEPRATRNPWDLGRTPGGSSSGSAAGVAAGFFPVGIGTQALGSLIRPASYNGIVGFKPSQGALNRGGAIDYLSQSVIGVLSASLEDSWNVAHAIAQRVGGDPGFPGLMGPAQRPLGKMPRTIALLQTPGWDQASFAAKRLLDDAITRLKSRGVTVITRADDKAVAEVEMAVTNGIALSHKINGWEWLWPLNSFKTRDAAALSKFMHDRMATNAKMTLDDYRAALAERETIRASYAKLAEHCEAVVTLSAIGPAPVGLHGTGTSPFNAPASMIGNPAISLPLFTEDSMPLGLQVMGFLHKDADLFAIAGWIDDVLGGTHA